MTHDAESFAIFGFSSIKKTKTMKTRILIAIAILLGGTVAGHAQTKPAAPQEKTDAAVTTNSKPAFLKTLNAYEQENDQKEAGMLFDQLKESMMEGIRTSKAAVARAGEAGDQEAVKRALQVNRQRTDIYNQLIRVSRNADTGKDAVVNILKSYAETL